MRLLYLFLFLALTTSCKKTICKESDKNPAVNAVVQWAGHPEVDGIGWVLHLENGKTEKPSNLGDAFKTDGLKVAVEFEKTTEKYPCFCANGYIEMIRIISIQKR